MKKRILSLFLCVLMSFTFVACGDGEDPGSDSFGTNSSEQSVKPGSGVKTDTDSDGDTEDEKKVGYDPSLEHKFIACDILSHGIVVFDLNACDGDWKKLTDDSVAVVWEWDPEEDPKCKYSSNISYSISGVRYRYSEYYKKDVVVACANFGWVGIIDYETRSVIWESNDPVLAGAHSVEMLPNGDLVVGISGKAGKVAYFPVSAGISRHVSSISSPQCHGVFWDPGNECVWVLEDNGVYAAVIMNLGKLSGEIMRVDRSGSLFGNNSKGGHAFSPVAGQPGKYWASSAGALWQFDAESETMYTNYPLNGALSHGAIKGVCSFADGTVVETIGQLGKHDYSFGSAGFLIVTQDRETQEIVSKYIYFDHREFYKVQSFTKDYQ